MDGQFATCHESLAQSQDDFTVHRDSSLERNGQAHLESSILLGVVAETSVETRRLAITSNHPDHTARISGY